MAALSLAFDILARDQNATRTFNSVGDAADRAGKKGGNFGKAMKAGMALAATAFAAAGAAAIGFAAVSIKSLARIEMINAQTEAAIKSMGGAAGVTAKQIEDMAGALENATATEAESIQQGANLLLTFGNIKNVAGENNDIFNQAVTAMVDLSRAMDTTGSAVLDQSSAAIQLGKALNDPIKGVTALQRVGISFTQSQKDTIKSLTESGDLMGAQKIILSELTKQFGGSAEAFAQTTTGRIELAKHAIGTLGETITASVLPVLGDFATKAAAAFNGLAEEFANGEGRMGQFKDTLIALKDAGVGVFNVLFKGDFTGGIFGLEEDSKFVSFLFGVRDAAMDFADALRRLWEDGKVAADVLVTGLKPVWDELVAVWNSDLKPAFQELATTLRDELGPIFGEAADEQGPLLKNLAEMTVSLVRFLLPSMVRGIQMFAAFVEAVAKVVGPLVEAWRWSSNLALKMTDLTIRVQAFVRDSVAGIQLFGSRFVSVFTNARDGAVTAIATVIATVRGLPGQVTGALGNVGGLLRNAGRNLIQGFIDGIRDMIRSVRSTLSDLTSSLPDWKGPMALDRVILRPSGAAVIDGFIGGMESRYGRARSSLGGLTSDLPSSVGGGGVKQPIILQLPNGEVLTRFVLDQAGSMAEQGAW